MIAALSLVFLASITQVPARQSRAEFVKTLAQVERGWTRSEVEQLLGKPDDIWPTNDSPVFSPNGDEIWCYGSKGHHSLPTLGRVGFDGDEVRFITGADGVPPPIEVIDEATLDAALRVMHLWRISNEPRGHNTAHILKVANHLIPLGHNRAVAVLAEYARLLGGSLADEDWLFWLVRVAFEPNDQTQAFRYPGIGFIYPPPPADLKRWPTYPVLVVDDFPLNFHLLTHKMGGGFESFASYVADDSRNWKLRTKRLSPPDDPFALRAKILAHPAWAVIQECYQKESPYGNYDLGLATIFAAISTGVKPAFISSDPSRRSASLGLDAYERMRAQYLALNCRWDSKQNSYVRGDGTTLATEFIVYPTVVHEFKGIPRLKLTVRLSREKADQISIGCLVVEEGTDPIAPTALAVIDEATSKQLAWMRVTGHEKMDSQNMEAFYKRTMEEFLAFPAHKPFAGKADVRTSFELKFGTKLKLVVARETDRFESPILAP